MKQFTLVICCIFVCGLLLCACDSTATQKPSKDIEETYIGFLETIKTDWTKAVDEYCHYEYKELEELAKKEGDYLISYEIRSWEKINDDLWAVTAFWVTEYWPDGTDTTHFVGRIDGQWRVMIGVHEVPEALQSNFDPEKYRLEGDEWIDPLEVIGAE